MLKVISFDVGGTLIKMSDTIFDIMPPQIKCFKNEIKNILYITRKYTDKEEQQLLQFLSLQQLDMLKKHYLQKKKEIIFPHMSGLLKQLSKHYKIIISSNRNCLSQNYVDFSKIENNIHSFFYSNEIGIVKNNPDFFIYCADKLQVLPSEILHIGDNVVTDFKIPLQAKCHAILWNNSLLNKSMEKLLTILQEDNNKCQIGTKKINLQD